MPGARAVCAECGTQTPHRAPPGKTVSGGAHGSAGVFRGIPVPLQTSGHSRACWGLSTSPGLVSFLQNVPGPPACRHSWGALQKRPWTGGPGRQDRCFRPCDPQSARSRPCLLMNAHCEHGCWKKAFQLFPLATILPASLSDLLQLHAAPGSRTVHPLPRRATKPGRRRGSQPGHDLEMHLCGSP